MAMIRKKLLFAFLLLGIVFGLESCLDGDNVSSFRSAAVIVDNHTTGGVVMSIPYYGLVSVPSLQNKLSDGDCIYASYTINFDKQPTSDRVTVTDVEYLLLPKRGVRMDSGDMINEYNDSILGVQLSSSLSFYGNLFVQAVQQGRSGQEYELELICNPDSIDANGVNTVFLKSKAIKSGSGDNLVDIGTMEAFDLNPLISAYGKDTIVSDQRCKVLSLNFKYQISDEEGVPVYHLFNNGAIEVMVAR